MRNRPVGILFLVYIWLCIDQTKADQPALFIIMELYWKGFKNLSSSAAFWSSLI